VVACYIDPYMRDLWSDWEDRWSPKRLPQNEIQTPAPVHFENRAANGAPRAGVAIQAEARSAK
jgi:hypothetical protein